MEMVTVTNLSRTAISARHYVIRLLDKRAVLIIAQGSKHSANFHSVTVLPAFVQPSDS